MNDSATAYGFLIHRPNGDDELFIDAAWNDQAVSHESPRFDERETLYAIVPVEDSSGVSPDRVALEWKHQIAGRDQHVGRFGVNASNIDAPTLKLWQVGLVAETNVGTIYPQEFGRNFPLYEVNVDEKGVAWNSAVRFTRVEGMRHETRELVDGEAIIVHQRDPGRRANVVFEFDVFAPGITNLVALKSQEKAIAVREMEIRVES